MALGITKEELQKLPIETFAGEIIVIDKEEDVANAIHYLTQHEVLGFDTETKPAFRKNVFHKVALMQIASFDRCYLFRLNKIKFTDSLGELISNKNIKKIGLSLQDDFAALRKRTNCIPTNFIDLQKMVIHYGIKDMSLQKIYAILFKKRISKKHRLSNWEAKQLKESQLMYAAIDAWACLRIYHHLIKHKTPSQPPLKDL